MNAVLAAAAAALLTATSAQAVVVDFDDLTGQDVVADGYGGIVWGGDWVHYGFAQLPYTPNSDPQRIYANYDKLGFGFAATTFSFLSDVVFNGAFVAGQEFFGDVYFELFLDGVSVATSAALSIDGTPTFLASGYSGLVDSVAVWGSRGYYVLDDITYDKVGGPAEVPVPAALPLMLLALAGLGLAARRRAA